MEAFIAKNKDVLDVIVQLILVLAPIVISWLIRNYVKNSTYQMQIGSITRLANVAIDYVENLEKRGELQVPEGMSKGTQKLQLAANWLDEQLKSNGISIGTDDAVKWISSVFQNRVGGVAMSSLTDQLTHTAVDLVQGMEQGNLSAATLSLERIDFLISLATDWLITQLANQRGVKMARDEAEARIRAEILNRLQGNQLPSGDKLKDLARQALEFLDGLKQSGRKAARPNGTSETSDRDVAVAWMLVETTKLGISVPPEEIVRAVTNALQARAGAPTPP
jgi:hypothetical protein